MRDDGIVQVEVPMVPKGVDVHRSLRRVLTGVDESAEYEATLMGPEVGHGAVIETMPGVLLLVVDERVTGWREPYQGGKRFAVMDAELTLHLVQDDGALKALWTRHFKTSRGAFGAAARQMLGKHLAAWPPVEGLEVREVSPGPGRPNFAAGPCRWCEVVIGKGGGVLVGRGPQAVVEHRENCPPRTAQTGTACGLCGVPAAPGTARLVLVRKGAGRWETRHTGRCDGQPSLEAYEQQQAEQRATAAARLVVEKAAEAKRAASRAKAAEKRAEKADAARAAAEELERRVESLGVVREDRRQELYDKGLDPYGQRMRLVEVTAVLTDGESAVWWEVAVYGGGALEGDDRGGRFYLLDDARYEYQQHKFEAVPYEPPRRTSARTVACPSHGAKHCDHCGSTVALGGWMSASLGRACGVDCYDAMADARGAHDRQHHGAR